MATQDTATGTNTQAVQDVGPATNEVGPAQAQVRARQQATLTEHFITNYPGPQQVELKVQAQVSVASAKAYFCKDVALICVGSSLCELLSSDRLATFI